MATLKVKTWKTDNSYAGKAAVTYQFSGSVWAFDKKGNFVQLFKYASKGITYGIASGRGVEMSNGVTYWLITLKNKFQTYEYAYVANGDFYFSAVRAADEAAAKNDAQVLFNSLVASDKKLLIQINTRHNLLQQMAKKGINVDAEAKKLTEITNAFTTRQKAMAANPALKVVTYFKLSGVGNDGVGIIPLVIGLAIGAGVVLAGLVVYYFLKPEFNASQLHSKYLEDNEAELKAKLGPEAYEKLKQNITQEIQENAQDAYDDGKSETLMGTLKTVGLMAAGFYLITKIQSSGSSRKAA